MNRKQKIILCCVGLVIILFMVIVWPTKYKYLSPVGGEALRINRFTGKAEVLGRGGWEKIGSEKEK
ncbi:MAG TPA: hypothetical protein PLP05_08725 [Sedimentisphaerales bacterium]|nr:hypothetical protein [Sedimentisphaerales bacterium]